MSVDNFVKHLRIARRGYLTILQNGDKVNIIFSEIDLKLSLERDMKSSKRNLEIEGNYMKNQILFMIALVLVVPSLLYSQSNERTNLLTGNGNETIQIEPDRLSSYAKDYLDAIAKGDAKTVFSYMNPVVVEKLGGEKNAKQFIEKQLKNIHKSINLTSATLEIADLVREGNEPFNRMAIKINVAGADSNVKNNLDGLLVPIPYFKNQKQGVYFLHTEGILTSFAPSNCQRFSTDIKTTKNKEGSGTGMGVGSGSGRGNGSGIGSGAGTGSGSGAGSGRGSGDGTGSQSKPTNNDSPPPVVVDNGKTSALKILSKPRPRYGFLARINNVQGSVILRVSFLSNGQIGSVSPVRGLPCGLTERAIEAARTIKFAPLMKDGKPTSVTKSIQFNFNNYGSNDDKFEDLLN